MRINTLLSLAAAVALAGPSCAGASVLHIIAPGESLTSIAAADGLSIGALAAANDLSPDAKLFAGATLEIPSAPGAGTVMPTAERVSGEQISSIALAYGVSPSLAQAVAWQESGFNNDLVSYTGASGVMQIQPETWNWIHRTLTGAGALSPASALDNVRAGVLLLRALLTATGGDQALAVAGYYQGLQSVRAIGAYRSTQRYVDAVLALERRFAGR